VALISAVVDCNIRGRQPAQQWLWIQQRTVLIGKQPRDNASNCMMLYVADETQKNRCLKTDFTQKF